MATKTFRLTAGADNGFAGLAEVDQTAATRTDGWTVGKIAAGGGAWKDFAQGTKATFTANFNTAHPVALTTGANGNAFKTPAALNGTFAGGSWSFTFAVRASTASAQTGSVYFQVYKSANADGTSATLLSGSAIGCSVTSALSTTVDVTSAGSWSAGAITLTNEFLFFAVDWSLSATGGSNNADVLFRTGQSSGGTRIDTPDFAAAAVTAATPQPVIVSTAVRRAATR